MDRARLIAVAAGREPAELTLLNVQVVNVYTNEIETTSIGIDQGMIASIGISNGTKTIDCGGRYAIPGLVDSHVHIESALVSPEQFALLTVPHGTTTIIVDPHEIANVCGLEGIRYMIDASLATPLDVFFMLPSCVPATSFENAGAVLGAAELATMIDDPHILGLGEMMDYPSVIAGETGALAKIDVALRSGKPRDGHAPMVVGSALQAYRAAGIETDHECSTIDEMVQRLRLGMRVLIREGSAARNLSALIKGVTPENAHLCSFCTDDKQPADILEEGHIDHNLRLAIAGGIPPVTAIQMATINATRGYGLSDRGAIAPGLLADIALVDDLEAFKVRQVYKNGKLVAEGGAPLFSVATPDTTRVRDTVNVAPISLESFRLALPGPRVNVIQIAPQSLITRRVVRNVHRDTEGYFIVADEKRNVADREEFGGDDVVKLAVIERHNATGNIGLALVEGFGIRGGALATTIAHDSHNVIVVGDNDRDMLVAVDQIVAAGGGMCAVVDGAVMDTLELPIAGLMSNRTGEEVSTRMAALNRIAFDRLGVNRSIDPFMTLSFLALPVIPEIKLTDRGLFDVTLFDFIPLSVEDAQ